MADAKVVIEDYEGKVILVSKNGPQGSTKVKMVEYNGKNYTVGKNDKDKVKVGQQYHFKLTKSEYNDKLYYWANLISGEDSDGEPEFDQDRNKIWAQLQSFTKEQKIKVIKWLLDRI